MIIVLEVHVSSELLHSLFINFIWMRVALEAQTEARASSVEISRGKVHPRALLGESMLDIGHRSLVDIRVVAHRHQGLCRYDAIWCKNSMAMLIEIFGEEGFAHTVWERVSRINDDDIE